MAQGDKYAVRLNQPIEDPRQRAEIAAAAAPRFGVGPAQVEKLISRKPGPITKRSDINKALEVVNILSSVGVDVDLVEFDEKGTMREAKSAAPPTAPRVREREMPVDDPAANNLADNDPVDNDPVDNDPVDKDEETLSAQGLLKTPPTSKSRKSARKQRQAPAETMSADDHGFGAASEIATRRSDTSLPDERKARAEPNLAEPDTAKSDLDDFDDDLSLEEETSTTRRARFPLLAKLLLGTLVPIILLVGVTLYFANNAITDSTTRLLSEVGDNIAITLAADFSNYLFENNLTIEDEDAVFYFTRRLNDIEASLNETVGIHYTDAEGVRIQGNWEPEITQNSDFPSFESGFRQAAQAAIQNLDFGAPEERQRATLEQRRVSIGGELGTFYTIATPLRNDVGTVQVVIAEGNIVAAARGVLVPIGIAAGVGLLLTLIVVTIIAIALSRRIRRLVRVAQRIADAKLDEPVDVEGNDETRQLAEALEEMRQELQAAFERLKQRERAARRRGRR